ncbi:MAG: hypothetical protein RID42_07680 [Alphaproteobacteria bacterium]
MMNIADIAFAPFFPWWSLAALAAAAVALVAFGLWRRASGIAWRLIALTVVLAALANPSLVSEERDPLPDVAIVVVDESQSQGIGERAAQTARALAEVQSALARYDDIEVRVVASGATDADSDTGTRLFEVLGNALSDIPPDQVAGAILITDGQVHDVPDNLAQTGLRAPVHVLLSGTRTDGDRRLVVEEAPSYGIVGTDLEVAVRIEDTGQPAASASTARVTVRLDGGEPQFHRVPIGETSRLPLKLDHGGLTIVEIDVDAATEELTLQNNRAAVSVSGVRDRLRVLLVSGEPHAGERTWRNLLKADPSVDLVHFTILRPPEKQDGTSVRELSLIAFPTRELFEVKLDEFDLIIFDRYRRRGVLLPTYVENIAEYVKNGGALLEAAGPAFATPLSLFRTPLGRILPAEPTGRVYEQGFRPALTDIGRRHPVTSDLRGAGTPGSDPDWGRWFRMVESAQTAGAALMSGPNEHPLLVVDRVGDGRIAQLLSDHAWLWARGFEGGGPQAELLRRLAHWLMKEPDLEEEELRAAANGNTITIERRSLSPEIPPVRITGPSGATQDIVLSEATGGRFTASFTATETGLYRFADDLNTTVAAVGAINPREFADVRATAARLQPVVDESGGRIAWLTDDGTPDIRRVRPGAASGGRDWIGVLRNESYFVTGVRQVSLLPALAVLLLLIGGLMFAWYREGR